MRYSKTFTRMAVVAISPAAVAMAQRVQGHHGENRR